MIFYPLFPLRLNGGFRSCQYRVRTGDLFISVEKTPTSCFLLFYVVETGGLTLFAKSR